MNCARAVIKAKIVVRGESFAGKLAYYTVYDRCLLIGHCVI